MPSCTRTNLKDVLRVCGANAANVKTLVSYTPMSEIASFAIDATSKKVTGFTLVASGKWQKVEISNKEGVFKGNGENGTFKPTVEGFHPKTNVVSTEALIAMMNVPLAVIVEDGNGDRKFIIDTEFTTDGGMVDGSKNGYSVKFENAGWDRPCYHLDAAAALVY